MKKEGFSLIEVVLALGILALLAYAALPLFGTIYHQVDDHYRQEEMLQCARKIVETRLSGEEPKKKYLIRGRKYELEERIVQKDQDLSLYQWTLKGEKDEKSWQCLIPKEGIYTP